MPAGKLAIVLCLCALASVPAAAGTMDLQWDPVPDSDLAGYRVYYGTAHSSYTSNIDVGNVTSTTLTGLADCTTWYVAVKAYDLAGNESEAYSNEVSGLPRPAITSVSPSSASRGTTLDLTVTGASLASGATVALGAAGVTVNSVTYTSCTSLRANVTISGSAPTGATTLDVTNPDGSFGTSSGLFSIAADSGNPYVASTVPASGAGGVSIAVRPTITFSEPMLFASITVSNVRLLNATGKSLAQAIGSPSLSPDGKTATITPLNPLASGTYRIQAVGGPLGVLDLSLTGMVSTFTQSPGFTVTGDTTPPTISSVQSSNVGTTSARVTWTTNEPANGQVFYRKSGTIQYQRSGVARSFVTSHTIDVQGLSPSTTYQYHVTSSDVAGNVATSAPDKTFTTAASSYAYIRIEAEAGGLTPPLRIVSATGTFGDAWIDTPARTATGTAAAPAGTSRLGVNVPTTATWYLWVLLYGPDDGGDLFWESIDGAERRQLVPAPTETWVWVAGRSLSLTAGLHTIELGGGEARTRADRVILTNDPLFVPTEQVVGEDVNPPGKVTTFTGTAASGQVMLSWRNPSDADFTRTIVRYRTDGYYPTSPVDGFLVVDRAASPGSTSTYTHASLSNGTEYRYSAFAVDASGNIADRTSLKATPNVGLAPPEAPAGKVAARRP